MDNNSSKNSSKIPEPVKQVIGIIGVLEEALAEGAKNYWYKNEILRGIKAFKF